MLCSATSAPVEYTVHPEIQVGIVSFINPSACAAADGEANAITIGGVPAYDYLWSDSQTTPSAIDLTAGAYSVTVTDANGCQSTDAVSLSDPGSFMVSLVADPTDFVICEGTEIEFTASGANGYEFFVDGFSAGTTNPYVNSAILDGQTIAATGTDVNNCTATSPGLTYQVNTVPSVSLDLLQTACSSEDTVEFSGGFPLGGEYTVIYNGFPIVGDLFFPDLAGAGSINVDYTYTAANGCPATASDDYEVLAAPEVDLGADTTVCMLTLDPGAGYDSYHWTPNGETTPTIQAMETNVFGVTVVDSNGCVGTDEIGVTINPIPAPVISPSGPVEFCIGDSVTISAPSGYSSYTWSTGSVISTSVEDEGGIVTLIVMNQYGCEGMAEVELIMNEPMAGAQITPEGPHAFCNGESITLDAGSGYASYLWNSGSTTQTVNVIESGEYTVIVLDGNGCIDSSMTADPVVVTVWEPEPILDEAGDSLIVANVSEFVSYQWYLDGNLIAGATGDVYVIEEDGSYMVCGVDTNGCEGCSFEHDMNCCVGIEEAFFDGDVNVYPNPNSGQFTLEVEMQRSMDMTVGLYDMVGKQIWLDKDLGNSSSLRKQYDMSQIPDGVYFLRIHADDQMTVQKLIKQQ